MSDKDKRRARGAKVMQELRQRRAARMGRGRATKVEDGVLFVESKVGFMLILR